MSNWTREESLIAFNFYCRTPFGRLHGRNPEVIRLAQHLGRTPGAVAMKCCNFASFDPAHQARGVRGLGNTARIDRELWEGFLADSAKISTESEAAFERTMAGELPPVATLYEITLPVGPTERWTQTRVRLVQSFFRATVLTGYSFRCAICRLDLLPLLTASHIIPWGQDENRRADPTNGLSLCALHDRAFDRGFLTLDESLRVVLSERAKEPSESHLQKIAFTEIEGESILLPERFHPDPNAISYHRENIFQ